MEQADTKARDDSYLCVLLLAFRLADLSLSLSLSLSVCAYGLYETCCAAATRSIMQQLTATSP